MSGRVHRPRDSEPGYAGDPQCGWGQWIAHEGGQRPEFVRGTALDQRGDPVDYVGINRLRGTGRNLSPDWDRIRWFRLRADHPHYGPSGLCPICEGQDPDCDWQQRQLGR